MPQKNNPTENFDEPRKQMVEHQLVARGIRDEKVLGAMSVVPRHDFVDEENRKSAYGDFPLPIGHNQTISQPYIVALMTELLAVKKTDHILEIGTGCGYQSAILSRLADTVYSMERIESLATMAKKNLARLSIANVHIKVGDGTFGWPEHALFDKIIIAAATPSVPIALCQQIKDKGLIVVPLQSGFGQCLTVLQKNGQYFDKKEICHCIFVPLVSGMCEK